jgi:phosphoribosylanthranilate isomerase
MWRTRIKFCGITRLEDALTAAELGADAIGLVLHADSARRVTHDVARQIIAALPPFVTPVGLFVDAPPDLIDETAAELRLRHVQLHGKETPLMIAKLRGRNVIKVVHVTRDTLADELKFWRAQIGEHELDQIKGLLLETGSAAGTGGTGAVNDWEAIRAAQDSREFTGLPPIIAAGGLRPETVATVVRMLRPWAVDVSSGIESAKGIKSAAKMAAFVEAVRVADSS